MESVNATAVNIKKNIGIEASSPSSMVGKIVGRLSLNTVFLICIGLAILGIIVFVIVYYTRKLTPEPEVSLAELRAEEVAQLDKLKNLYVNTQGKRSDPKTTSLTRAIVPSMAERQNYLVNLCPLTVRLPGYLGPLRGGIFDEKEAIRIAVAAGARGFFIPLSYYVDGNKKPPLYPESQKPAVVARANTGEFISKNGGFLHTILQEIVAAKSNVNEPFLVFLHGDSTLPNSRLQEQVYSAYISAVADACKQLQPYLPKQVGQLGYTQKGRGNQSLMLQIPVQLLTTNIIVFTNLDFSMEDDPKYKRTKLGDFINIRYTNTEESADIGKVVSLDTVKSAGDTFRKSARIQYTIALPANEQAPSAVDVQQVFAEGIQCVPLDLLASADEVKEAWNLWRGAGWIAKQESLRYTKPEEIVPQKPSAVLNARVDGAQFAGQLVVK
jgi:hypothetical protein